jgi:8-oxo-(d)GTP phosphatase
VDELTPDRGGPVRAAGGVLWRRRPAQAREIALVHRPKYNDLTLPKGKLHRGEHPLIAACREVEEETAVRPVVQARLASVTYQVVLHGELVDKVVDYWTMSLASTGEFIPGDEIDAVTWLEVPKALSAVSYEHDREVIRSFADQPEPLSSLVLVRHADAGERGSWPGPDLERPLDSDGRQDAAFLADLLGCFAPARLIAPGVERCVQTLAPLASRLGRPIERDQAFAEAADPVQAAKRIRSLAASGVMTVVCSQGGLIPPALAELLGGSAQAYRTPKGTGWHIAFTGDTPVRVEQLCA